MQRSIIFSCIPILLLSSCFSQANVVSQKVPLSTIVPVTITEEHGFEVSVLELQSPTSIPMLYVDNSPTPALRSTSTPAPTPKPTSTTPPKPPATPTTGPTCQHGTAEITYPVSGQTVSGVIKITGTATCDQFDYYKFEFVDPSCSNGACFVRGKFTRQVVNGILDSDWDTSRSWNGYQIPNGTYRLRLTVVGKPNLFADVLPSRPEVTITIINP